MKRIIDISSHTTISNYDILKDFDGVYIKATEGATYISPTLDTQVQECIKRNIPFGFYHFAGKVHTSQEEYSFFKSICNQYPQRLLPDCLDYENSEENIKFIDDFMSLDNNLIFYSYRSIVNQLALPKNKIWVAIPSIETPSLNGYLGIQYHLDVNYNLDIKCDSINNCDISIFDDSIVNTNNVNINNIKESVKMRLIKKGENSKRVLLIQSWLNVIFGTNLQIDGDFGDKTYNAIVAYQTSRHLLVDGVVGTETVNELIDDSTNLLFD